MDNNCDKIEITKADSLVLMQTINKVNVLLEKFPQLFTDDNLKDFYFSHDKLTHQDSDLSSASSVGSPQVSAISLDSCSDSDIGSRRNSTLIGKFQQFESLTPTIASNTLSKIALKDSSIDVPSAVSNDLFTSSKPFFLPAKTKVKGVRASKIAPFTAYLPAHTLSVSNNFSATVDAHIKRPLSDSSIATIVNRLNEFKSATPSQNQPPAQMYTFSQLVGNPRFEITHDVYVDPFDLSDCCEVSPISPKKARKHPSSYEHYKTMYQTDPAKLLELRKRHREMVLEAARSNPIIRNKNSTIPITVGANRQVFEAEKRFKSHTATTEETDSASFTSLSKLINHLHYTMRVGNFYTLCEKSDNSNLYKLETHELNSEILKVMEQVQGTNSQKICLMKNKDYYESQIKPCPNESKNVLEDYLPVGSNGKLLAVSKIPAKMWNFVKSLKQLEMQFNLTITISQLNKTSDCPNFENVFRPILASNPLLSSAILHPVKDAKKISRSKNVSSTDNSQDQDGNISQCSTYKVDNKKSKKRKIGEVDSSKDPISILLPNESLIQFKTLPVSLQAQLTNFFHSHEDSKLPDCLNAPSAYSSNISSTDDYYSLLMNDQLLYSPSRYGYKECDVFPSNVFPMDTYQ